MPETASNRETHPPQLTLEEWLQLSGDKKFPETAGVSEFEQTTSDPPAPNGADEAHELTPLSSQNHVSSDRRKISPTPAPVQGKSVVFEIDDEKQASIIDEQTNKAHIRDLENILAREFSDTLTGFNAITAPLGAGLLILSIIGWSMLPVLRFFRSGDIRIGAIAIMAALAVSGLAGIHFLLYWAAHRGSNLAKTKELDRLLETRRVIFPCEHIDCEEIPKAPGAKPEGKKSKKRIGRGVAKRPPMALRALFGRSRGPTPLCGLR